MTELNPEEIDKLESIVEGLALAVYRSNEFDDSAPTKVSKTKLEKFIYKVLKSNGELNEITHSWYLAGVKTDTPDNNFLADQFQSAYETVSGIAGESSGFVDSREGYNPSNDVQRYADFFLSDYDLEETWYTRGEQYLLDFYETEAPPRYRELYVTSQKLRNQLNYIVRDLVQLVSNNETDMSLAQFGQGATIRGANYYRNVTTLVSELHKELAQNEELRPTLADFRAFTDILEDACLALSKMEVERIDVTQLQVFKTFRQFHFYQAWRIPAFVISLNTVDGPREQKLQLRHARQLEEHQREFPEKLGKIREQCAEAALKPTLADYPSYEEEPGIDDELIELYVSKGE